MADYREWSAVSEGIPVKHILILEDTPTGVDLLMSAEGNGVADYFPDSLLTHLVSFLIQHIDHINRLAPVLRVQMEEV